jgi:polysaccharide export outer membrane protein
VVGHVKSVVRGGGIVKVPWAVACLLAVLLAAGCSNKQTVKPDAPPIKETPIEEESVQPTSISLPAASIKGAEGTAGVEPSLSGPQYKLGPEDQIRVSVWENAQLTLDLVVRPDGKISMPLIQDVTAEGQTAAELATQIQQKLTAFIKEPQVSVIMLQINAPKFYVIGNVVRPGTYPLRGETSVLQALSLAGGFTQFASLRSIKLIRNAGGKQEVRKINYYDVIDKGGEGNYILKSGDTIVVP